LKAAQLDPDDRLRLIARLWASLPPEHWAAPSAAELAEVERRLAQFDSGQTAEVPWEIVNRMLVRHEATSRRRVYSAPRRFDLATVFVVTTAYSLLLAALSAFQLPAGAIAMVTGFITLVGVGQAFLFHGQRPRLASILMGLLCYTAPSLATWFIGNRMMPPGFVMMMLGNGIVGGAVLGYLAGVLVGGVFLVADVVRRKFGRPADDEVPPGR
jgi:putative addiction module component (TIGR02574 family)